MSKPFTTIAAVVFLIVAAVHAYRIYAGWSVVVGGHDLPITVSWAGLVVAVVLAMGLFAESRR